VLGIAQAEPTEARLRASYVVAYLLVLIYAELQAVGVNRRNRKLDEIHRFI